MLGEVLAYRVIETPTVLPEETKALVPRYGEDLASLVNCTLLDLNSHQMLVTAQRVLPTSMVDLDVMGKKPGIPGFPLWAADLGAALRGSSFWIYRAGRNERSGGSTGR